MTIILLVLGLSPVETMLLVMQFNTSWASRKQAIEASAETTDHLSLMVGTIEIFMHG